MFSYCDGEDILFREIKDMKASKAGLPSTFFIYIVFFRQGLGASK